MSIKPTFLSLLLFWLASNSFASEFYPVSAKHTMVVSAQHLASQIGSDILKAGGNAIDAAVAVGYALAVVDPCCGNIGGGGFMTIHLASGKDIFLNFRGKAPLKANARMFFNTADEEASVQGYLAVAVPGTVRGLDLALQKYGTLSRQQVIAPAIRLAEQGFNVTPYFAKQLSLATSYFAKQPNVAVIFLNKGQPFVPGQKLIQKNLANTLKLIAKHGPEVFYKGPIAHKIVSASQRQGGILSLADFENYDVETLQPVRCNYRGYTFISSSPPSSGGTTLCEILNILENFPLQELGYRSVKSLHIILEAMRYGFADRNSKLGDPDFIKNPITQLISKDYAAAIARRINQSSVVEPVQGDKQQFEHKETTHYSIVDDKGNAVAVTYTLNGFFGAKVIAGETGFFLNNDMDDFATKPGQANKFGLVQYDANKVEAGKRPLSSMTPTIVMKDGRVIYVIGSPGGPRIITSVLLTMLNIIDYGMNIQQAVDAPRFHYQGLPNLIVVEPFTFPFITTKLLNYMGYHIETEDVWGSVEVIYVNSGNGLLFGASDHRHPDGAAIGT